MRYKDVQTGQTFFFEDNFSYPKRKTPHGHLDIRDDVTGYMPDDTPVITLAELAALTARVKELEEEKDKLEKAAFQAVAHVAAANYPEREREAYNMLYAALRGEA